MRKIFKASAALALAGFLAACSSTGTMSIAGTLSVQPTHLTAQGGHMKLLGSAHGRACRGVILGIIPYGDSTFTKALENALKNSDGDALINVATTTDLYSYIPIYNVFDRTCTAVQGTAVKIVR